MRAWMVTMPRPIDDRPLAMVDRPVPEPGPGDIRVQVATCGVCRTDLHLAEGDLAPKRPGVGQATRSWAASEPDAAPPELLNSAILFAPAGALVPVALEALDRGGTLAIAGIRLTAMPPLDYQHHLFQERHLRSVTANTRADGEVLFAIADRARLRVTTHPYPLDRADAALADLAHDRFTGAAVLRV